MSSTDNSIRRNSESLERPYQELAAGLQVEPQEEPKATDWHGRAIEKINKFEKEHIDARIPHLFNVLSEDMQEKLMGFQERVEHFSQQIKEKLAPLVKLNAWLNRDEIHENIYSTKSMTRREEWKEALKTFGIFLAKLPLRAARNILAMVVNIVKEAVYTVAHPAKATMKLARMIANLLKALTEPERGVKSALESWELA